MGEAKRRGIAAVQEALVAMSVEAIGARIQVRWNQHEAATPFGQMAYFAEFLNLTGLYRRWIESCPLRYASPNGSKIADVLGTLFLSVLSGHWRYAHIAALRAKVATRPDASCDKAEAHVAITLNDGRRLERHVPHATGSLEKPMTDADIEKKFHELAASTCSASHAREVIDIAWSLERLNDAAKFVQAAAPETV